MTENTSPYLGPLKMMQNSLEAAKRWAEEALAKLRPMTLDDRILWYATKPGGQVYFNRHRLTYVVQNFPEYRARFEELGLKVRS